MNNALGRGANKCAIWAHIAHLLSVYTLEWEQDAHHAIIGSIQGFMEDVFVYCLNMNL